jgi:hypothetical protein
MQLTILNKLCPSNELIDPKNNVIGQCAEESSAVMKPSLPQYTPLVSGVSASGTVQCSTLGPLSYTYYSIAGIV